MGSGIACCKNMGELGIEHQLLIDTGSRRKIAPSRSAMEGRTIRVVGHGHAVLGIIGRRKKGDHTGRFDHELGLRSGTPVIGVDIACTPDNTAYHIRVRTPAGVVECSTVHHSVADIRMAAEVSSIPDTNDSAFTIELWSAGNPTVEHRNTVSNPGFHIVRNCLTLVGRHIKDERIASQEAKPFPTDLT